MDAAAKQAGIDCMTLREHNLVTPKEVPCRVANGERRDRGDFPGALRAAGRPGRG